MPRHVQLRVHGVSGTTPEELLGVDAVGPPVAGDDLVRFVRPADGSGDGLGGHLEGMSWGRLTSGSVVQATWLLLLPFAVLNLGYWARSWNTEGRSAGLYRGCVRSLGLALTMTITFSAATISMDQLAWQCMIRDRRDCVRVHEWLTWAQDLYNGPVLVIAAGIPFLLVLALAFLSYRTALRYEAFPGDMERGTGRDDPHLFSRRMWRGELMVSRLRMLHVAVGCSMTAAVLAAAGTVLGQGVTRSAAWPALGLAVIVIVWCVAWVSSPRWLRWTDDAEPRWVGPVSVGASIVVLALAVVSVSAVSPGAEDQQHLPGVIMIGHVLLLGQIAVLLALLVTVAVGRRHLGDEGEDGPPGEALPSSVALWGFAGWFISALAVILGFAYSAAAVYRATDFLSGRDEAGPCERCQVAAVDPALVPAFGIAAAATGAFIVLLLPLLAALYLQVRRHRKALLRQVRDDYPEAAALKDTDERVQRALRPRLVAEFISIDQFRRLFLLACIVGIGASVYAGWVAASGSLAPSLQPIWLTDEDASVWARSLRTLGTWAVAAFAFGLIALGVLAWRNDRARRLVGILWDVLSFWPRAGHPLAPPSYAERAVPQLTCRVQYLSGPGQERPGSVVLAGHSQGSVLAVAALAQLPRCLGGPRTEHVALLTYGSPIMRLFTPVFPRLFGERALMRPRAPLFVLDGERWTNLWRPTDPIGSSLEPILSQVEDPAAESGDKKLMDPAWLTMIPRQSAYPPVRGHSDYPADDAFDAAIGHLLSTMPAE